MSHGKEHGHREGQRIGTINAVNQSRGEQGGQWRTWNDHFLVLIHCHTSWTLFPAAYFFDQATTSPGPET